MLRLTMYLMAHRVLRWMSPVRAQPAVRHSLSNRIRRIRWLFRLAVLLFLGIACSGLHAQLKRNVLHIRFQKVVIHPTTTDTTVDTYYWIESYSPFTFTGFDFDFNYENTKCAPESASFFGNNVGHGTRGPHFTLHVQAHNEPQSID